MPAYELPETLLATVSTQVVYTRRDFHAAWIEVPGLHCTMASVRCNPDLGRAIFTYAYGVGQQPGSSVTTSQPHPYGVWPRLRIAHWNYADRAIEDIDAADVSSGILGPFVKVEFTTDAGDTHTWHGVFMEDDTQDDGSVLFEGSYVAGGVQTLHALGIEWLLAEIPIESSVVESVAGMSTRRIKRVLAFNEWKGEARDGSQFMLGNRSESMVHTGHAGSTYAFSKTLKLDTAIWNAREIIEYLANTFPVPAIDTSQDGASLRPKAIRWRLKDSSYTDAMAWERPRLSCEGRSVKDVLDELLNRRRSLGYRVDVVDEGGVDVLEVVPFSFNESLISIVDPVSGTTETILAAEYQYTLDLDRRYDVSGVMRKRSHATRYDVVTVRGHRRTASFTLSNNDSTLEADWSSGEQTSYNTAASGAGDYPSNRSARSKRNAQWRSEPALERVYRYFRVPEDWDGKAGDADGGTRNYVMPKLNRDGSLDTGNSEELWWPGLRLQRHVPLLTAFDYSSSLSEPTFAGDDYAQPEQMAAFVAFKLPDDDSGTTRYAVGHRLSETDRESHYGKHGPRFTTSMRPQDVGLGIVVEVNGESQHMIASSEFTPLANAADEDGKLNWKTDMLATVSIEGDTYAEARWPDDLDGASPLNWRRELVIHVGDRYRLDYVAPNTIFGFEDGVPLRNTDGGFSRDDRPRLMALAQLAHAWYSKPRVAVEFTLRRVLNDFEIGHLITTLGTGSLEETINSVVTGVDWHFGASDSDEQQTAVYTGFAELDVVALAGGYA